MPAHLLHPHPTSVCPAIRSFEAQASRLGDQQLELRYSIEGEIDRLLLPPWRAGGRAHELWRHSCFEAFLRIPTQPGYLEFNFAPSGDWAIYRFAEYRRGMTEVEIAQAPAIQLEATEHRLELKALVDLDGIAETAVDSDWRLALSAVIEEVTGRLSYWALAHPSQKPDFHHEAGFLVGPDRNRTNAPSPRRSD